MSRRDKRRRVERGSVAGVEDINFDCMTVAQLLTWLKRYPKRQAMPWGFAAPALISQLVSRRLTKKNWQELFQGLAPMARDGLCQAGLLHELASAVLETTSGVQKGLLASMVELVGWLAASSADISSYCFQARLFQSVAQQESAAANEYYAKALEKYADALAVAEWLGEASPTVSAARLGYGQCAEKMLWPIQATLVGAKRKSFEWLRMQVIAKKAFAELSLVLSSHADKALQSKALTATAGLYFCLCDLHLAQPTWGVDGLLAESLLTLNGVLNQYFYQHYLQAGSPDDDPEYKDYQAQQLRWAAGKTRAKDNVWVCLPTAAMLAAPSLPDKAHDRSGRATAVSGDSRKRMYWAQNGVLKACSVEGVSARFMRSSSASQERAAVLLNQVYGAAKLNRLRFAAGLSAKLSLPVALDEACETWANHHSYDAVLQQIAQLLMASEQVMSGDKGRLPTAMVIGRPPGHHDGGRENGFCLANIMVCAVMNALLHNKKVLLIDLDVHSGDGTVKLFLQIIARLKSSTQAHERACGARLEKNLCFINLFQDRLFPYAKGFHRHEDCAEAMGVSFIKNIAYAPRTKGSAVAASLDKAVAELLASGFKPDISFYSYGLDAHSKDAISSASFTDDDYAAMIAVSPAPTVAFIEGGYSAAGVCGGVQAGIEALARKSCQLRRKASASAVLSAGLVSTRQPVVVSAATAAIVAEEKSVVPAR